MLQKQTKDKSFLLYSYSTAETKTCIVTLTSRSSIILSPTSLSFLSLLFFHFSYMILLYLLYNLLIFYDYNRYKSAYKYGLTKSSVVTKVPPEYLENSNSVPVIII